MKQAILGLHSSRGSTSQVTRTSTGVHGPESRLRTSAVQGASLQAAHRPKPTIFTKSDPPTWYRKLKSQNLTGHTTQGSI